MKVEYFPETDTLSIIFAAGSFEATNEDELSDVLILRDGERIGEIVIEHASKKIDMAELHRQVSFEEVRRSVGSRAA